MEIGSNDERVKLLISIGTPLSKYDFDFLKVVASHYFLFTATAMNSVMLKNCVPWLTALATRFRSS